MKIPSKEEVLAIFKKKLDAKDYEAAAKIAVYYPLVKMGPEKFAQGLVDAIKRKLKEKELEQANSNSSSGEGD